MDRPYLIAIITDIATSGTHPISRDRALQSDYASGVPNFGIPGAFMKSHEHACGTWMPRLACPLVRGSSKRQRIATIDHGSHVISTGCADG